MSIIIEDIEDIELLIAFYNRFGIVKVDKKEENTQDVFDERMRELNQYVVKLDAKLNKCLTREDILEIIRQESTSQKPVKKEKEPVTIRKYRKKHYPFQITGITAEGKFTQKKGKPFSFDIFDVLKLKKLIPKTEKYPSFEELSKEFDVYTQSLIRLSYLIETGEMDVWLNEWEQIEADNFYKKYGDWKPKMENNPQKRKEQGMV